MGAEFLTLRTASQLQDQQMILSSECGTTVNWMHFAILWMTSQWRSAAAYQQSLEDILILQTMARSCASIIKRGHPCFFGRTRGGYP